MGKVPSATVVIYPAFLGILFLAPLMRGLFFSADLLPFVVATGFVLLAVAVRIFYRRERIMRGALPFAFLALAASYGISYFVAASPIEALRGFLRYLMYFGVYLIAAYLCRDRRGRRAVTLGIFFSATAVALIGLSSVTEVFAFPGASQGARIMSTLQYPNALAAYLMFSSIIGLTLMSTERSALLRLVYSAATFCQTLVFLSSYSRGGWVVYPIALAIMFAGMPKAQRSAATYHVCTTLTTVLMVVRRFSEAADGDAPRGALLYILSGVAIAVCFQIGLTLFRRVSDSLLSPQVRRALGWVGATYAGVTVVSYLIALAGQYNAGAAGIVSASMFRRFATISIDDPSLLTRAFATRDALRIFLDHPILGGGAGAWNAWYHGYQTVLYWTTEVHNHFAQVLVETGVVGFCAYMLAWGSLIFAVVKFILRARSRDLMDDSESVALTWGVFTACLAMGIHSAMDFELSLPGVSIQLWAAFAVVFESTMRPPVSVRRSVESQASSAFLSKRRLAAAGIAVLSFALLLTSYRLMRGASYGAMGSAALIRQDFHTSAKAYQMASGYDPLSASYHMDRAQAYAAMALLEGSESHRDRALAALDSARDLEPHNLNHRQKEIEVLVSLGEPTRALEAARQVLQGVPLHMQAYEAFARLSVVQYMAQTNPGGQRDSTDSDSLLAEVVALPDRLTELKQAITGLYQDKWSSDKLDPSSTLNTYVGQAYYLRGDLGLALTYFDRAVERSKSAEVETWRTATRVLLNQLPGTDASPEVLRILSYFVSKDG